MDTKTCSKCKEEKLISEFHKSKQTKDKLHPQCKSCQSKSAYKSYLKRKEYYDNYRAIWRKNNPDKIHEYSKKNNKKRKGKYINPCWEEKQQVLFYYSNGEMKCERCGIDNMDVLTINHINHNGYEHRKNEKSCRNLQKYLIRNNFPDGYNILCRNCNWLHHVEYNIKPKFKIKNSH